MTRHLFIAALIAPAVAHADDGPIADNSFLVEEAYNQPANVVQHIQSMRLDLRHKSWGYTLEDEWPVPNEEHQLSVSIPVDHEDGETALGDVRINYRRELFHGTAVVVTPRVSLWLRPGQEAPAASAGVQLTASVSIQPLDSIVLHSNLGITAPLANGTPGDTYVTVAQSVIWLAAPRFNLLFEATSDLPTSSMDTTRRLTISPGVRTALDFSSGLQIVPGVAAPYTIEPDQRTWALLFYLSFEHPLQTSGKEG